MPSKARKSFDQNAKDIERLLDFHADKGGNKKGRRYGLEVLNKSAIVLITACWEAYCEDLAAEGLLHIVKHAKLASALTKEIKQRIAKDLKNEDNELAVWDLSDNGWREVLKARAKSIQKDRNRKLNTPKTNQINELFYSAIGRPKISSSWHWGKKMTVIRAEKKLDKFVSLRGEIAHRGTAAASVKKIHATDYFEFIGRLAAQTGGAVNVHIRKMTRKSLW